MQTGVIINGFRKSVQAYVRSSYTEPEDRCRCPGAASRVLERGRGLPRAGRYDRPAMGKARGIARTPLATHATRVGLRLHGRTRRVAVRAGRGSGKRRSGNEPSPSNSATHLAGNDGFRVGTGAGGGHSLGLAPTEHGNG